MARKFLVSIDLTKNELQNARIQNLATAPSSPVTGQIYYDTDDNRLYYWDGTEWIAADGSSITYGTPGSSAVGDTVNDGASTDVARADHRHGREGFGNVVSGTSFGQSAANGTAVTVPRSDHTHGTPTHDDAAHSTVELNDLAAPDGNVSFGGFKLTNLGTPTADTDAATKAYVDAARAGLDVKDSVRAATQSNVNLSNPGTAVFDGVTLSTGDRLLVKSQTAPAENGIYVFNGSGVALTRATDADTSAEVTPGLFVFVEEGTTDADAGYVLTTNQAITLGTTSLAFSVFSRAGELVAGAGLTKTGQTLAVGQGTGIVVNADDVAVDPTVVVRKYAASVGNASATSFNVDHNLNTLDVVVQVFKNSDGTQVEPDITRSTVNRVVIDFAVAPATNEYRVVVHA